MQDGRVRVVLRPGVVDELGRTPQMAKMLATKAGTAVARARQIAPRGDSPEADSYRGQIEAEVGRDAAVSRHLIGRVVAKKFTSHWIEWGTVKTRAHATLRRAVEGTGLRIRGGRRS